MQADLFAANVDFQEDLVRNIPAIRQSQNLFDDLSLDPADWDLAIAAESAERTPAPAVLVTGPFDYGTVVSYSFDSANWAQTRFSDGRFYGVWYGAIELETTVYETAWHWSRFVLDSFAAEDREINTDRRVFNARCDALLVDLRGREVVYPDLVNRRSYEFTHQVGRYAHSQGLNGLLYRSARCAGTNAAILRPERLTNVRDRAFLTYRFNPARDTFVAESTPGHIWRITPSALG